MVIYKCRYKEEEARLREIPPNPRSIKNLPFALSYFPEKIY
jgi:hypothetical protein